MVLFFDLRAHRLRVPTRLLIPGPSWKAEMSEIPRETVLQTVLPILSEAFGEPADPRSTHFANSEPDCGLFGTLDALTAEQASTPVEDGGATAAAQAEHVRFSLDVSTRWMNGERDKADWARNWDVTQVDDDAFLALTHASGVRSHLWMSALAGDHALRMRVLGSRGAYVKHDVTSEEEWVAAVAFDGPRGTATAAPTPSPRGCTRTRRSPPSVSTRRRWRVPPTRSCPVRVRA